MLFYEFKVSVLPLNEEKEKSTKARRILDETIGAVVFKHNEKNSQVARFYICHRDEVLITLAAVITDTRSNPVKLAEAAIKEMGFVIKKIDSEEITSDAFAKLIHKSERNGFIDDEDEVLQDVHLGSYRTCMTKKMKESLVDCGKAEKKLRAEASRLPCGPSLCRELDRIFFSGNEHFITHPVHYVFCVDDKDCTVEALRILACALFIVGRLKSRRIATIEADIKEGGPFFEPSPFPTLDMESVNRAYETISGGAVCLRPGAIEFESETVYSDMASIEDISEVVFNHRKDCLTILSFTREERKAVEKIKGVLNKMKFVEIYEEAIPGKTAKTILRNKAKKDGLNEFESLFKGIENDVNYYYADINRIYDEWIDKRINDVFYPQYREIEYGVSTTPRIVGNAYDELQHMIGLGKVKKVINQAIDFNRFQKRYQSGIGQQEKPAWNMVFTGNPGTAKTTVARLFAQIMKDNHILRRGNLVEVGRQDLVGKYVGWTSHQVEEVFDRARGSVLFIDEAYSLCDDRSGMFGDEAINTIVQLMENRRDETVVIFAGYPDKMKSFLERNPGLRSRISFYVDFDDYNEEELIGILKLMAEKNRLILEDDVEQRVREIIGKTIGSKDFGNGRFVRNMLEKARMAQASRIMTADENEVDTEAINTLRADDFELPEDLSPKSTYRPIGFAN